MSDRAHRVLLAPDSFKGTFTAQQVAGALARGAIAAGRLPDRCPLADGGEGTLAVLHSHLGGGYAEVHVHDPLGRPINACYLRAGDGTAIVETAQASGLGLVSTCPCSAEAASTYGTGELLAAAAHAGARHLVLTVGGSATTDGGTGALAAIDHRGGLRGAHITVLCDVTVPFEDAATIFAPQKGAAQHQLASLTGRLHHIAQQLSRDPRGHPRTGCAGGLSGALWANHGADLIPGADYVMDRAGIDTRMAAADLVITGEGALDPQTLQGKLVAAVAARARQHKRPCAVIVGRLDLPDACHHLGITTARPASTLRQIRAAAETICDEMLA